MDESNFSASTEGTASPSSTPVDATSASSTDAGREASVTPQGDANASPATPEMSPGWSYEGVAESQFSLPDSDDDIQGMLGDPNLDATRTPGLVTALQEARKYGREQSKQVKTVQSQIAALDQYGGYETALEVLPIFHSLFNGQADESGQIVDDSTSPFLDALHTASYPRYERLVKDIIEQHSEYALKQLQERGLIPSPSPQSIGSIDQEVLASLPEKLKEQYKKTPAEIRAEYDLMAPEAREFVLDRDSRLDQLDSNQRQQAESQWRQAQETAATQGRQSIETLSTQYETAHYKELAKWTPYGPENKQGNERVYKEIVEGAHSELLADAKFLQMYQDASQLLQNAPMRRLMNEKFQADADERKARDLAMRFNTRLGQLISERVKERDSIYRDARAWREHQRQQAPNRTEISGSSNSVGQGGEPPRLGANGKTNPAWLDFIASRLPSLSR